METAKRIKTAVETYQARRAEIKKRVHQVVSEVRETRQADMVKPDQLR